MFPKSTETHFRSQHKSLRLKHNHILFDSYSSSKPPKQHTFKRLFSLPGEWTEAETNDVLSSAESLTSKDKEVFIGLCEVMFSRSTRGEFNPDIFSQFEIGLASGRSPSSVNRTLSKTMTNSPDFIGYNDESHSIKRANCTEEEKRGKKALNRKINKSAKMLVCSFQGFSVEGSTPDEVDKELAFKSNKIRQKMLRYSLGKGFLINLPRLAKLSPFFFKIFEIFKRYSLITNLKKKVIYKLGIKQVESFSKFSVGALLWAEGELRKMVLKSKHVKNISGFLWYKCVKYHRDYQVLFE